MDTLVTTKESPATAAEKGGLNARLLIVHDSSGMKVASDALRLLGYVVDQASDERQVQAILGRATPSLILLDFALPGVVGLIRKLKLDRKVKHVPIVAVTASALNGGDGAHAAGCDGCIIGPVDTRKLPLQVAAFLVRGKPGTAPVASGNGRSTERSKRIHTR